MKVHKCDGHGKVDRALLKSMLRGAMPTRSFGHLPQLVQHLPDSCRKLIPSERFLKEIYSLVQNAAMGYQVGGIA